MSRLTLTAACSLFVLASSALAQVPNVYRVEPDHSATDTEAALRGFGAAAEGLGVGLHNAAAAQVLLQEARQKAIQNRYEAINSQQLLKSERDHRERAARVPSSQADLVRRAREATPGRISVNDVSLGGELYFPAALQEARFADLRDQVQEAFNGWRSSHTATDAAEYRKECEQRRALMAQALQQEVKSFSAGDYLAAKKFLDRLGYETRVSGSPFPPATATGLASR